MKSTYIWAAISLATCSIIFSIDRWNPPKLSGSRIEVIPVAAGATGPESLAFDPDGEGPYTGVSDGRILKWQGEELGWHEYAVVTPQHLLTECKRSKESNKEHLCGRPLGLQFYKNTRDLYVADAYFGLLMVRHGDKFATPVVTQAEGLPLHFTNSLDIAQDTGLIYFTDSSMQFQRREFMSAVISGDKSGRVLRYDPRNNEVQVLLSGLSFPNGVAISADGSHLLVAESTTCRILRYRLRPARDGAEVLVQLPGFPDNIEPSPRGGFWVALYGRRGKLVHWLLSVPLWIRRVLLMLPLDPDWISSLLSPVTGKSLAVRISEEGRILEVLEGFGGKMVRHVSEVEERNGTLWIGSVFVPFVGVYTL